MTDKRTGYFKHITKIKELVPMVKPKGKLKLYLDSILKQKDNDVIETLSIDSAEDPKMTRIRNAIFKPRGKEIIPPYLRNDMPSKKGLLAKEWALRQNKYGDRPSAEVFERVCKELYIKHCSHRARRPKTRVKITRNPDPIIHTKS